MSFSCLLGVAYMPFGKITRSIASLLLIGFFVVAGVLHFRGFSGPMYCDSVAFLQENSAIFANESPINVIKITPQRPVAMLSFYLDYILAGMNPFYFRLVNTALLAVTSTALFLLVLLVMKIPAVGLAAEPTDRQIVAVVFSALFLAHPVQIYAVLYIWQRMALLACLFYLVCLAAYVATRLGIIRRRCLGFAVCGILFILAVFSKENAVTLPVAIILIELILFRQSFWSILKVAAMAVPAGIMVFAALIFIEALPGSQESGLFHMIRLYYRISGLTPWEVALTQSRMLFDYLALSLAPFWVSMPFWVAPVISRSLFNPPETALAAGGVLVLIGLSLGLIRRLPLTSFGMLFFILNLIPESIFVPTHIFFAYRTILPLVGLILAAVELGLKAWEWAEGHGPNRILEICLVMTLLVWLAASVVSTYSRAAMWINPVLVWEESALHLPSPEADLDIMHYVTILDSLGAELQFKGRHKEAVQFHERSLKKFPTNMRTLSLMATALVGSNDPGNAEIYFKKALEARATDGRAPVFAHNMYGEFLERAGRKAEAVDQYAAALEIQPDVAFWQMRLGRLHMAMGQLAGAEKCFRTALELEPSSPEALYDLASAVKPQGKLDEAIKYYETALSFKPDNARALNNLGRIMEAKGEAVMALNYYARALEYDRKLPEAHLNIGNVLTGLNRLDEAIHHYRSAIAIRPDYSQAHNNIGVILEEKGDLGLAAEHYRLASQLKPDAEVFLKNLERVTEKLHPQMRDDTH
jgi:protein O-mannosyl-transferase